MAKRAVILPHFGDPITLYYWLGWFKNLWSTEVSSLYIYSSNILNIEHKQVIQKIVRAATDGRVDLILITNDTPIQHGNALRELLEQAQEELVMLVEEDTVIFKQGKIDECFRRIESGEVDAVGSPRGSCSDLITTKSYYKYGPLDLPGGSRDNCYNFWPNFFFGKREDLLATDRDFNGKGWFPGESIPELGIFDITEQLNSDTFVNTSIQLRAAGLRFGYVEQYHGSPNDMEDFNNRRNVFDGKACWVHHGSLSGWRYLLDENPQAFSVSDGEMERRLQWYKTFVEAFEPTGMLPVFVEQYKAGIRRLTALYGTSENQLTKRQLIYQRLFEGRL